ncbi:DUF624 domain-containing protein [Lacticaseibacillus jixiensis]|uniref:DUF624 domain-containing protein n=1 Tax=Lacticaseibacillus jixiensis TaxID=3231926 RepID=UPI0036F356FF
MRFLVDPKTKSFKFLSTLLDLFFLNMLFLITSLPLVTLGPSMLALHATTMAMVTGKNPNVLSAYFGTWRHELGRGFALSGVVLALIVMLWLALACLPVLGGISHIIGLIGVMLLAVVGVIMIMYVFTYTARYQDGFFHSLKVSMQIALLNLRTTLLVIGVIGAILLLFSFSAFFFTLGTLLTLLFGFAAAAYFVCDKLYPVFLQYEYQ